MLTNFLIKNVDTRAKKVKVNLKYLSSNIFSKVKEKESIQNYKKEVKRETPSDKKLKTPVVKTLLDGIIIK